VLRCAAPGTPAAAPPPAASSLGKWRRQRGQAQASAFWAVMMVYQTASVLQQSYIKLINGTGPCSSHGMMAENPPALTFSESREIVSENLGSLAC